MRAAWAARAASRSATSRVKAAARASWCRSAASSWAAAASWRSRAWRRESSWRAWRFRSVSRSASAWASRRASVPGLGVALGLVRVRLPCAGRFRGTGRSVDARRTRRLRLPALVHPQPLLGMAAHHLLEHGGEALRVVAHVLRWIAGPLDAHDREHVDAMASAAALAHDERRHHWRVGPQRDARHPRVRAGGNAEKVDEPAEAAGRGLIDRQQDERAFGARAAP